MRSQKDVARQLALDSKAMQKILRDPGIRRGPSRRRDQPIGIERRKSSYDHHVPHVPLVFDLHGPRCAAAGMAGGLVGRQNNPTQPDGVAIVQHARDVAGGYVGRSRPPKSWTSPVSIVRASPSITISFAPVSRITSALPAA